MIPDDLIYSILELLDIEDLRKMRLVCKEWKEMVDKIRIGKLEERVILYTKRQRFHRWTLYTILMANSKKNSNSWVSKKKTEEREILLF